MTCLTQSGHCCFFWKGRWKEHQSSNRYVHIQVPTDHFWGCVGEIISPPWRPLTDVPYTATEEDLGSEFTNVRVLFLEVCKFTTFCDRKGYTVSCALTSLCIRNAEQNFSQLRFQFIGSVAITSATTRLNSSPMDLPLCMIYGASYIHHTGI